MKKKEKEHLEEIKLILLGESGVGKTSIIQRYLYDQFDPETSPSITMNFAEKVINVENKKVKLNIWDTIGQEKYRSLSKLFLNETNIVILVYSKTDPKSFEELTYWNNLYKEQIGDNIVVGVAGNKSDLIFEEKVTEEQGKEYAEKNKAIFAQLSAKENKFAIDDFFMLLTKEYLEKIKNKIHIEDFEIIENRKKGIVLSNKTIQNLGYQNEGCCGGKAKARQKKYNEILKKNNGIIDCIFLGDIGVGKTSLIKRIADKNFDENEEHTEDLTIYETKYSNSTMVLNLKIYDINNEEKKSQKIENIIKKSQIYFLVYDINNIKTMKEVEFMAKVIRKCKKGDKNYPIIVLLANKKDLRNDNKMIINDFEDVAGGEEKGEGLAKEIKALFFKTTAKDDKEIKEIIGITIEKLINLP
jgi:small GTP-binding protein